MNKTKLVIRLTLDRTALRLALLASLLTLGGSVARAEIEATTDMSYARAPVLQSGTHRQYYLTDDSHDGADADTACAGGYHMASLWEILDVSNLRYDTTLGYQHSPGDGGQGPPTGATAIGWVRTGNQGSIGTGAGNGNCGVWSQSFVGTYGSTIYLPNDWNSPGTTFGRWVVGDQECTNALRVWCVED